MRLLALALLLLATACSPKTRPATFYLLQPIQPTPAPAPAADEVGPALVGLGPVTIPAYLDRPQIVTGSGGAQLRLNEFERWAEPLRDNLTRVLAENLAALLPASHVLTFPWNRAITPDYQVEIHIARFHADEAGGGELKADWSVLKQSKPVSLRAFRAAIPAAAGGYENQVAAQSQALAALSRAIAEDLRKLARGL